MIIASCAYYTTFLSISSLQFEFYSTSVLFRNDLIFPLPFASVHSFICQFDQILNILIQQTAG